MDWTGINLELLTHQVLQLSTGERWYRSMRVTVGIEKVKRFERDDLEIQFKHSLNRSGFINSFQSLVWKISKLSATSLLFLPWVVQILPPSLPSPFPASLWAYPAKLPSSGPMLWDPFEDELHKFVWIIKVSEESSHWHHLEQAYRPRVKQSQVSFLPLPFISCVPLSKLLNLSEPQLAQLKSECIALAHRALSRFKWLCASEGLGTVPGTRSKSSREMGSVSLPILLA